jgi:hypothetical protein
MMSLVVGFSFFLSFFKSKKEKKEERKKSCKKSSREKEAKNQFTKGVFFSCANMKELMMMNSNFLHSFKEAVT